MVCIPRRCAASGVVVAVLEAARPRLTTARIGHMSLVSWYDDRRKLFRREWLLSDKLTFHPSLSSAMVFSLLFLGDQRDIPRRGR